MVLPPGRAEIWASMELSSGCRRTSSEQLGPGGGAEDRISALPDDLLLLILDRLPCAGTAARTGVLSRRWRGLWARLRRIVFRDVPFHSLEPALARVFRPPPTVSLLDIRLPGPPRRVPKEQLVNAAQLSSLLRAAARLDPEELLLVFHSGIIDDGDYDPVVDLPCFHRATSMVLNIEGYGKSPTIRRVKFLFPALETLSLSNFTTDFNALLSCCPRLRTLRLTNVQFDQGVLMIDSPLLQELVVATEIGAPIYHVNIVAPVLKQLTMSMHFYWEMGISVFAPMMEKVSWTCFISGSTKFGMWRVRELSLQSAERQGQSSSLHIHANIILSNLYGEPEKFTHEIERHIMVEFSVLELHLVTQGHVFGAFVCHLIGMNRIRCAMQRLNVDLRVKGERCPPHCHCDSPDWRSQTISLTSLEEVKINGFDGEDHELDFLKYILRCAPMLKRIIMKLSEEASASKVRCRKIYNIFGAYSSVQCYLYLNSGLVHGSDDFPST